MRELIKDLQQYDFLSNNTKELEKIIEHKEENTLTVAVVGQFKRGKSTLINSIMGQEILPVGIVPLTSIITRIKYGENFQITIYYNDGKKINIDKEELSEYVSEAGNPNNIKEVNFVDIQIKCDLLQDGLTLVDTPGIGSMNKQNTDVANDFIKKSDAVIFLLSVDSPMNELEYNYLEYTKNYVQKFYFTVNKIDLLEEKDLNDYCNYCQGLIQKMFENDEIILHRISAKNPQTIQKLLETIKSDFKMNRQNILDESIKIKIHYFLNKCLEQIDLYSKMIEIPLEEVTDKINKLEDKSCELKRLMDNLEDSLKRQTMNLTDQVETVIKEKGEKIENKLQEELKIIYEENNQKKSKDFVNIIETKYQNQMYEEITHLNEFGLEKVEKGYEEITDTVNAELKEIQKFIQSYILELFNIQYDINIPEILMSSRSDFIYHINRKQRSYLINMDDFIFLLPRKKGNKIILKEFLNTLSVEFEKNQTNMIYNYNYKMKESLRSAKFKYCQYIANIQNEINHILKVALEQKDKDQKAMDLEYANIMQLKEKIKEKLD